MQKILLLAAILPAFSASLPDGKAPVSGPTATAKVIEANYCFAELHGLLPERLPAPALVLKVRLQIAYHDGGGRPLILPLNHESTVWMSKTPGVMKILHQPVGLMDPAVKPMMRLPADVNPDNPVNPKNDVFGLIPAGGDLVAPLEEDVILQIYKTSLRERVDLRGKRVYVKLQFDHQPLSGNLEAQLSDRWSRFGVPWTGALRTNTLIFDIPTRPNAHKCPDLNTAHPARLRL
jgi:hypothetical protein